MRLRTVSLGDPYTDANNIVCDSSEVNPDTGLCIGGTPSQSAVNQLNQQSMTPYSCNTLQAMLNPTACASASSPTPALPSPPPPTAYVYTGSCPPNTSLADGTCSQSGVDANGNPIYVSTTNPQGQSYHQQVTQAVNQQVAAGYVDCTSVWNQLFNAACPCTICQSSGGWLLLGGAALLALVVAVKVSK
jgi:hypothetical protein